jgi:membrane-associated protease RseP (regulator of RpoE activity)
MRRIAMETLSKRGAAAAFLALAAGASLGAQTAGSIQPRQQELRDSLEIRRVIMTRARLDSLATLMRELNALPAGSAEYKAVLARVDALMPGLPSGQVMFRSNGGGVPSAVPKGWIGINAQGPKTEVIGPNNHFLQYFDYPAIVAVDPDSPAQRAGIVPGDVLIGYDGVDVRGHRFDLVQMLVPEKKLSVSVRHEGEMKDYVVTVAPAPPQVADRRLMMGRAEVRVVGAGDGPRAVLLEPSRVATGGTGGGGAGARAGIVTQFRYVLTPNGAFGAVLSTISPELAKTLKLEPGVLVNDIMDETPASRGGLRPGDVIVSVAGQSVSSLKALHELIAMRIAERSVVLQVVRDRQPQKVTVNW